MEPATDAAARVRRLSAVLRVITIAAALALAAAFAALFAVPGLLEQVLGQGTGWIAPGVELGLAARAGAFAVTGVNIGLALAVLWAVAALFGCYKDGMIFTDTTARWVRRIGQRLLALSAASFLGTPALSLILSMNNPEGQRMLSIEVSDGMLATGLMGGLMLVIGWVMQVGVAIDAENAQFV